MEKRETREAAERRQDHARRLKIAVRRAHDPVFTVYRSPPQASLDAAAEAPVEADATATLGPSERAA